MKPKKPYRTQSDRLLKQLPKKEYRRQMYIRNELKLTYATEPERYSNGQRTIHKQ